MNVLIPYKLKMPNFLVKTAFFVKVQKFNKIISVETNFLSRAYYFKFLKKLRFLTQNCFHHELLMGYKYQDLHSPILQNQQNLFKRASRAG